MNPLHESKTSVKQFESYDTNPFGIEGVSERTYTKDNELETWIDESTGEARTVIKPSSKITRLHDSRKYVKLFVDGDDWTQQLPLPAFKLLFYLIRQLNPKQDIFHMEPEKAMKHCGWKSKSMYYKGLLPLLQNDVLAKRSNNGLYYVNTNKIFNGDRTDAYLKQLNND